MNISVISRGKGRSAVGASAYRAGEKITNEYDGLTEIFIKLVRSDEALLKDAYIKKWYRINYYWKILE